MKMVALDEWLGRKAGDMDPATIQFRARLAPEDRGDCCMCLFKGQKAAVCVRANEVAQRAGLPDCDTPDAETGRTFIYVRAEIDPRQIDLVELAT